MTRILAHDDSSASVAPLGGTIAVSNDGNYRGRRMVWWGMGAAIIGGRRSHNGRIAVKMKRGMIGTIIHRVFSAIFGLALALAGLTASGYIPTTFKGYTLPSGAVAVLIPGVLMLSAFYMAFRFLKFAVSGKK